MANSRKLGNVRHGNGSSGHAGEIPLPDDAYYVDGSWDLSYDDVEGIREIHNGGQQDEITEEKSKK